MKSRPFETGGICFKGNLKREEFEPGEFCLKRIKSFPSTLRLVSFAAVFRLVTQRSSPQTAAFFRTTCLSPISVCGEERCVTSLKTAAKETTLRLENWFKNATITAVILDLCSRKLRSRESRDHRCVIVFSGLKCLPSRRTLPNIFREIPKISEFPKMSEDSSARKRKVGVYKFSRFEKRFRKAPFS